MCDGMIKSMGNVVEDCLVMQLFGATRGGSDAGKNSPAIGAEWSPASRYHCILSHATTAASHYI